MNHCLDIGVFRCRFPEFEKTEDAVIARYWEIADIFITAEDGPLLDGRALQLALELTTAHCLALNDGGTQSAGIQGNGGGKTGFVSRSTIDKVTVQFQPPSFKDGFDYWANATHYGQQLLALLKAKSAGGFYIGGAHERCAFRKAGGSF